MRWEDLFADLEAQLVASFAQERDVEVADRVASERAGVSIADRLRAHRGTPVELRLRGGEVLTGGVVDVAAEWALLGEGARRHLVPRSAVSSIAGLGTHAAPPAGEVPRLLGLGSALRALGAQGRPVLVVTSDARHLGRIVAVGQDHLDVAPDSEGFGAPSSVGVIAVPFAALIRVSSG